MGARGYLSVCQRVQSDTICTVQFCKCRVCFCSHLICKVSGCWDSCRVSRPEPTSHDLAPSVWNPRSSYGVVWSPVWTCGHPARNCRYMEQMTISTGIRNDSDKWTTCPWLLELPSSIYIESSADILVAGLSRIHGDASWRSC